MPLEIEHEESSILLSRRSKKLIRVAYGRNRLHYHRGVVRLQFEVPWEVEEDELVPAMDRLLRELWTATGDPELLLYRTTVPASSPLLPLLLSVGFLECRRVFEPVLQLHEALTAAHSGSQPLPGELSLVRLENLIGRGHEVELVDLFKETYQRASRLDPATPERLTTEEWREIALGEDDHVHRASSCLLDGDRLIGMANVYRTSDEDSYELGVFGVRAEHLAHHQEYCRAMLLQSCAWLQESGARTLTAEIDADDPWTMYACARLPFHHGESHVSLAFMPNWQLT